MKLTVKKSNLYQILLGLCCAVPYLSNYELTFLLWIFTIIITLKKTYSIKFITYLTCFIFIFILAFFLIDYEKAQLYFIIRDVTYILKPVLGLLLGYQICVFIYKNALETLVYAGFGISILHLILILKTFLIYHNPSVALIRDQSGYFSDFEVYSLILVFFHKDFQLNFNKKRFYLLLSVIGFSVFMYLARTNFIQFVVLFLGLKGYFTVNKRAVIAISTVVITTVFLYSVVLIINPKRTGSGFEEFLYKIKVAPTEPFKSKVNVADYKDFNVNYRSVELIYTLKQVYNEGTQSILLGSGLGSQINLKQKVQLGDMNLQFISVLHNGFMTTYLKSGLFGLIILLFSIYFLFNQKKETLLINQNINYLLIGTSVFLLVSNWVLMGYYFTQDSKSILVGMLFAYKEITNKNHFLKLT
jgi:uncharacterized membrane protein